MKIFRRFARYFHVAIGLCLLILTVPASADRFFIATKTAGKIGDIRFNNEDIIKFDTQDKSGGSNGTWSIIFDGSEVGLKNQRIDGFYVGEDYILLSFAKELFLDIAGQKTRIKASDIVKFDWLSLGENNTSGEFQWYFDGSDVGVKQNIDAVALDASGNLVFSTDDTNKLRKADGSKFQARKQDLIKFSGLTGVDTAGSFEPFLVGKSVGLVLDRGDVNAVDIDKAYLYLATRGKFTVGGISGKNEDILRCDLISLPIEQCENPQIIFTGADFNLSSENLQGIQVEITTVANNDTFAINQNQLLSGVNVFLDNGHGPDSDPQHDPFSVTQVNGSASKVGATVSLSSGALMRLNANGSLTYDDNHHFDTLGTKAQGQDQFTYRIEDGQGDYADAAVTISIKGKNDAPTNVALSSTTIVENKPSGTIVGNFTTTDKDTGDIHAYTLVTGSGSTNNASFQIVGTQLKTAESFNFEAKSSYTIRVRSADQGGLTVDKIFTISISNGNDAPSNITLSSTSVSEDQEIGTVVGTLSTIDTEGSDTHTYSLVTGAGSTDNASFQIAGNILKTVAVFNATAKSSYSIRLRTTDSGNLTFDKVFSISVSSINHAPSFTKGVNQTVNEDSGAVSVANWASAIDDGDNNATQVLTFNIASNSNSALFSAGPAISASGALTFTPAADANGTATLGVTLSDDGGTANGGQDTSAVQNFTITISAINDKPDFTATDPATVNENSGTQTLTSWASFNAGATNESGQTVIAYVVTNVSNTALFSGQPSVSANGTLTYTPASNSSGTSTFTVTVQDNGGTANGGVDTSDPETFTITVGDVNTKPDFSAISPSAINEDAGAQTLTGWATFDPGASNESSQNVVAYTVSNVSNSTLFSVQPSVATNGTLNYKPAANAFGTSTFEVRVQDNGGTANGGQDTSDAQTFTITVNAVNDKPTFTATDPASVVENAGAQTVSNWATFNPGNSHEASQGITAYVVTNVSNVGLFSVQPAVSTNGTLTYTPASGASGTSTFTVTVQDNGGTANSGQDTSDAQSFTITVNNVNDKPTFSASSPSTVNEDAGLQTIPNWATFDPGASNESGQSVSSYAVSNVSNTALFSVQPAVSTTGTLTYTPAANANGTSTFSVTVQDNGGTTNGGQDTSDAQTFSITINAVNDKPDFTASNPPAVAEDSPAQSISGWAIFSAGASNESSQNVSSYVVSNVSNSALFSVLPAVATNGTLTYTPAAGANGTSTFDVNVIDDGDTTNGGVNTSDAKQFTITVNASDTPPTAISDSVTVSEDSGANSINVLANDTDPDGGTKLIQSVTQGANGTIVVTGGGTGLTYQPSADFCTSLTSSSDSFTYTLTPGSSTATVSLTVTCVNDAPVAQNKSGISIFTNMKRTGIDAGVFTGITDADNGVDGCSPAYSLASVTAVSGGTVSNVNSIAGTFDFEPTAGFTGTATLNYTVQDNGCPTPAQTSASASISLTVSGTTIWFVDPSAGSNGTGTLASPFNNLASAAAADASAQSIFLYTGTATTGLTLNSSESLIGQGVTGTTFDSLFGISPPSGTISRPALASTAPTVQGNVVMAANSTVRGLSIQPTSSTEGLSASNSTGLIVNEVSVSTTSATAVNLVNSDGTFSFKAISANGGNNGLVWNNSSAATGSLIVTGDGSNTSVGGNASGGTISGMTGSDGATTGIGVYLNNTKDVTLRRMTINGTNQNFGIRGFAVNGFNLEYATVGGTNGTSVTGIGEGSIYFGDNSSQNGLTGTATVKSSNISGGKEDNFRIYNISGSLNRITVTDSTFGLNQSGATDSVSFAAKNSGTVLNATLTGNTFTGAPGDLFEFVGLASTTMDLIFQNNSLSNNHAGNVSSSGGLSLGTAGTMTFNVSNNSMRDADGHAINLSKSSTGSSLNGTIDGNAIGVSGTADSGSKTGNGINLNYTGTGSGILAITDNTIVNYSGTAGIYGDNTEGTYTLDLTITGNTIEEPGSSAGAALALSAGQPSTSDDVDICAHIASNDFSTGDPNDIQDVSLVVATSSSSMRLPGYSGSTTANVESFVLGNNNVSGTVVFALADNGASASNFTGGSACSTP